MFVFIAYHLLSFIPASFRKPFLAFEPMAAPDGHFDQSYTQSTKTRTLSTRVSIPLPWRRSMCTVSGTAKHGRRRATVERDQAL